MQVEGLVVFGVKPNIQSVPEGVAFYVNLMNKLRALAWRGVSDHHGGAPWLGVVRQQRHDGGREVAGCGEGASRTVRSNVAGPDFFRTLGVPVSSGRDFADSDTATSPHVGIINEQFAERFFPTRIRWGTSLDPTMDSYQMTIVGVVKDHKYRSIDEEPIPMAWYMYAQIPMTGAMHVEMRVHGDPLAILPSARKAVQQMDPNLPLIRPMSSARNSIRRSQGRRCLRGSPGSLAFWQWFWWRQGSMERWRIA